MPSRSKTRSRSWSVGVHILPRYSRTFPSGGHETGLRERGVEHDFGVIAEGVTELGSRVLPDQLSDLVSLSLPIAVGERGVKANRDTGILFVQRECVCSYLTSFDQFAEGLTCNPMEEPFLEQHLNLTPIEDLLRSLSEQVAQQQGLGLVNF